MTSTHRRVGIVLLVVAALSATAESSPAARPQQGDSANELRDYLSANGFLNRGLYELAAADYRTFLSSQEDHQKAPVARYGLAVCLFRMGKYKDAAGEFATLRKRRKFAYAAEVSTILGQCHLALDQYAAAAGAFERVVERHEKHNLADDAAAGWAEALYLDGKYDEAVARSREFVSRWPGSPLRERTEFHWALALVAKRDYAAAAKRLGRFIRKYESGAFGEQATLLLAQCYHRTNALDEAQEYYGRVLKQDDSRYVPDAMVGLAGLLQQKRHFAAAGELLDRFLKRFGDSPLVATARLHRGRSWFEAGKYDKAAEQFTQSAKSKGAAQDAAAYWLAKCDLRTEKYVEAADRLRAAIAEFPKSDLAAEMNYDLTVALVQAGQDEAAGKALAAFRSKFPKHGMAADALQLQALAEHRRKRYDRSLELCRTFLSEHASHALAPRVAFLAAENQFLSGDFAAAIKEYRRFLGRYPKDSQALRAKYRLGMAYYRTGKLNAAKPLLAEAAGAAEQDSAFRSSLLALGDLHFRRGEWKQAERRLGAYLAGGLDAAGADDALLKLGLAMQRQERQEDALRAYERVIEGFEKSVHRVQALFERGQALLALDRTDEAAKAFARVLEEGGDSKFAPYARNHLGAIALRDKNYELAIQQFDGALASANDKSVSAEALFQRGQALMATSRFEDAEKTYAEFLDQHGSHVHAPRAMGQRAIALARQDRHKDAIRAIQQAERKLSDADATLRRNLQYEKAWCLRKLEKSAEAGEVYRALLAEGTEDTLTVHAILELAEIESEAKRHKQAAVLLKRLRDIAGKRGETVPSKVREQSTYRLAASEFELGNHEQASDLFGELVRDFPESELMASASFLCGEALFKQGKHARAVKHLVRVVERFKGDPTYGPALLRLGECLATQQKWARSEQVFNEHLERFGDSEHWFQARFGVGWAHENQGRFDDAIKAYEQVVARHKGPTAARAQFQIGECLFAKKQYKDAVRELLRVDILYAYPQWSAAALFEAGRCFEMLNKPAEARRQFSAVIEKHKDSRWAAMATQRLPKVAGSGLPGRTP